MAELAPLVGVLGACEALAVARASYYRPARRRHELAASRPPPSPRGPEVPREGAAGERREQRDPDPASGGTVPAAGAPTTRAPTTPARVHPRALRAGERAAVLDVLHSPRFQDAAPAAVSATLLDEQVDLASERTMYRLLAADGETRPRRDQLVHPAYHKPELRATAPNQVWSWDSTKLLGPAQWTDFDLDVSLDIFSRYVVGWLVAHREHADLAERLIAEVLSLPKDRQASSPGRPVDPPR